jgi:hypothetical protein
MALPQLREVVVQNNVILGHFDNRSGRLDLFPSNDASMGSSTSWLAELDCNHGGRCCRDMGSEGEIRIGVQRPHA